MNVHNLAINSIK